MLSSRQSIKKSLFSGLIWTSGGQFLIVLINLTINVMLARFLSPEEFGIMGIIMFFILLGDVLAKGGLSGALIRMEKPDAVDYSTVFIFNLIVSVSLYIILVASSGIIAEFYNQPQIKSLLMLTGLTLIVNAFQLINITHLIRSWRFKQRFIYEFSATVLSGLTSFILAYNGFGIWSLAVLPLSTSIFLTLTLIIRDGFHGGYVFSRNSFRKTYKFGVNTSLASLLETGFENVYSLVLGKYFSIIQVGYFYQAQKLQRVPNNVLNSFTQRVLFPVLSKKQGDIHEFNFIYQKIVILFTIMVGLLAVLIYLYAEPIVILLLGDEWFGSIYYLQLLVVASFFYMQEQFNRIIFKVFDKTSNILGLELVKKSFQTITIVFGVLYNSLDLLVYGFVLTNIFSFFINYSKSRKITNTFSMNEIITVAKIFISGVLTAVFFYFMISYFELNDIQIFLIFPLVPVFYMLFIFIFKIISLNDLISYKKMLKF